MEDSQELEKEIRYRFNRFRGRAAGYVEALNLNERQERAIISTIKSLSYDAENGIVDTLDE